MTQSIRSAPSPDTSNANVARVLRELCRWLPNPDTEKQSALALADALDAQAAVTHGDRVEAAWLAVAPWMTVQGVHVSSDWGVGRDESTRQLIGVAIRAAMIQNCTKNEPNGLDYSPELAPPHA